MRILVADDDAVSRERLTGMLGGMGHDVVPCADGTEAWNAFQERGAPDLAILDWMMPGATGPELCRRIRSRDGASYVYLILLTSRDQREDFLSGMEAGADDYISKPFDPDELQARIRSGKRILELQMRLIEQATHDALTGLWNRGAVLDLLDREIARSSREERPLSVLLADLDHFKSINDRFGHLVGDAVLREAASRMRSVLREYELVGRYGGEEFLVLLPGCAKEDALRLADRLRARLSAEPVREVTVTASLGAATWRPGWKGDDLLKSADDALYRAKAAGRNRVEA